MQKEYIKSNGKENIPLYLVENKNDLDRKISQSLIDDFLGENNNFHFKSISAALEDNNGINELFQELSEILYINEKKSGHDHKQQFFQIRNKRFRRKAICCTNEKQRKLEIIKK